MATDATEILAMESTAACDIEALLDIAAAVRTLWKRSLHEGTPARAVLLRDYERRLRVRIRILQLDAAEAQAAEYPA